MSEVAGLVDAAVHQGAADALVLQVGRDRQWTKQQSRGAFVTDPQVPETVGADQAAAGAAGDVAKGRNRCFPLTQPVGRLGPAAHTEALIEQRLDLGGILGGLE